MATVRFFANAEDFRRRALAAGHASPAPVHWFLLNTEANVEVDSTALDALDAVRGELERSGIVFAMARVKQDLRDQLARTRFLDTVGPDRVFMTLPTAVAAQRVGSRGRATDVAVQGRSYALASGPATALVAGSMAPERTKGPVAGDQGPSPLRSVTLEWS